MVDRYLARDLAELQDRLEELGIDPDDAESFIDDLEDSIGKLFASSETDSQDEEK